MPIIRFTPKSRVSLPTSLNSKTKPLGNVLQELSKLSPPHLAAVDTWARQIVTQLKAERTRRG